MKLLKMSSLTEKLISNYRNFMQIPNVIAGNIRPTGVISTVWSQRNIEKGKSSKFIKEFFTRDLQKIGDTIPVDISSELLSRNSKSGHLRAVVRESESKSFLEVWHNSHIIRTVDLCALDLHGAIYTDDLGTLEWSPDESKILYLAEKKPTKSEPFYKRKAVNQSNGDKEENKSVGEEYVFVQDWGEQLVGKKESVIAVYDLQTDSVEILKGVPANVFVAQPSYSPDGKYIAGVAYDVEPRKLGLIYCTNRPSTVFWLDFEGNFATLDLKDKSVKSPIFSPNGKHLVWLQRNSGGAHASCMALVKADLPLNENSQVQIIVDIVDKEIKTKNGHLFYGFYNSTFPKRPWVSDGRLLINTNQKYTINSYAVRIDNGEINQVVCPDGSQIVLDVVNDVILAVHRNCLMADKLVIGRLTNNNTISWIDITSSKVVDGLEDCCYKYLDLTAPGRDRFKSFNAIYLGPDGGADESVPLIVWPHGGPHSAFANYMMLETLMFLSAGYGILLVNYRGSIGYGQKSVEFLLGKIGSSDVKDCAFATDTALRNYPWLNPDAVALVGGSHGGFLVLHLSGQYPEKYKAVVARNPVTDVATMSSISDIPDWCYVEVGEEYNVEGEPDNKTLALMREASPIMHAHKVKAATLLQIGSKDLRVPPSQGIDYYYKLKANGVTTRMNLYEDNHPLGSIPNEMDNIINTILWVEKHLSRT